jgi:hypothetical protein
MKEIKQLTDRLEHPYISVTNMQKLEVKPLLRSIILYGMEKTYKSFLSVKNKASLSFVVLPKDPKVSNVVIDSLENINRADPKRQITRTILSMI